MRLASIPLQVANAALVVLAPAVFLAVRARLPERVPVHFGLDGRPNRWSSPDELWALFAIMAFLYGLLWLSIRAIAAERRAAPVEAAERYEALERERRRGLTRVAEASMLVANGVLATVAISIAVGSTPGGAALLRWGPVAAAALAFGGLGAVLAIWLPLLRRIGEAQRAFPGAAALSPPAERWRAGGLFYYAPEDPAVFVPKRLGVGLTLNFARPAAWLFLAAAVGLPLLAVGLGALL